jgi:hypothetical protein
LFWDSDRRTPWWPIAAAVVAGMLPFVVWQALYNAVRTGAVYLPAMAAPQFLNNRADGNIWVGLAGQLISPGKSLFVYSPILLMAFAGARESARRAPGLSWGLLVASVLYLLIHARIRNWSGDWGWGPRHLVPLVPLLMLPAAVAIHRTLTSGAQRPRVILLSLAGMGLAVQTVAMMTNWHYVYSWLLQQGRFDREVLAWSARHGQLGETVAALVENLSRMAGAAIPLRVVEGTSALTQSASNTINWWPMTAVHAGVPVAPVVVASVALAWAAWWLTRAAIRLPE